jgi:membrane protein
MDVKASRNAGALSPIDGRRRSFDGNAYVAAPHSRSLWRLQGVPLAALAKRIWTSMVADRLFGHAAELGFYFLFALFPTLLCASSILGLAARSAYRFYDRILDYLSLLIPTAALGTVLETFNQTAAAASSRKLTFGLIAAIWSASVGISAIQDTLNAVYKIRDSRSYIRARIYAIGLTILLSMIVTALLASLLGGHLLAVLALRFIPYPVFAIVTAVSARMIAWIVATGLLALAFAVIYYWAPDHELRRWQWLTPGGTLGIVGWLAASVGLRIYIHFFNNFTVTYGSLGAVIILLTWFYITGLMLLLGAEINSQIEAAVRERGERGPRPLERVNGDVDLQAEQSRLTGWRAAAHISQPPN